MERERFVERIGRWREELSECLAWAREAGDSKITQALKFYEKSLESLLRVIQEEGEFSQGDFWPENPHTSHVNQLVDRLVLKIEKLSLPTIQSSTKKTDGFSSRSRE